MSAEDAPRAGLEAYLRQVRHGLKGLPPAEADEIVNELRSHVLDRADGAPLTAAMVASATSGLGAPRDLARMYLSERMAERVEVRRSPWNILGAVWRLAGVSMRALFVFLVSLFGYVLGGGLILIAFLKPIFPHRVGFWVVEGPGFDDISVSIGMTDNPLGHDIMGWWIIPFGLLVGALFTFLTWRFGLASVRGFGRRARERQAARAV